MQELEHEVTGLKQKLAEAWRDVEYLRGQLNRPELQVAEPVERKPRDVVPVRPRAISPPSRPRTE